MAAEGGYAPLSGDADAPAAAKEEESKATEPAEPIAKDATGDDVGAQHEREPLVEQRAGADKMIDEEAGERAPLVDNEEVAVGSEVVVAVERDAVPARQEQHEVQLEGAGAAPPKSSKLSSMRKATKRLIVTQRLERDILATRTCRARCRRRRLRSKLCCFELCERKVSGYHMPEFLQMIGGVAAPTADAWLDWGVTIAFYLSGDVHWFEIGLTINLLSGLLSGGLLGWMLRSPEKGPTAKQFCDTGVGRRQQAKAHKKLEKAKLRWRWQKTVPLALVLGLPGLAPTTWTVMLLRADDDDDPNNDDDDDALSTITNFAGGAKVLKLFKALELIVEMMPQSILQTYVGVAYGKFDPSSSTFSYLLPVSVTVSLLGAGSTVFGLEAEMRNAAAGEPDLAGNPTLKVVVSLGSRYGIVGLLLRTAQVTALIFWISLLGCAEKGWAAVAVVLGVLVFGGTCAEAAYRGRQFYLGGYKKQKWKDGRWRGESLRGKLLRLWQPPRSVRAPLLWSAIHLALLGAMAAVFFDVQHVPNNYANKTLPIGGPGDAQHYDCHDRTSGLYPAYLASALCVLLAPLYAAFDPEHGAECMRGKPADEKLKEKNAAAERRLRTTAASQEVDAAPDVQVDALWGWVQAFSYGDSVTWTEPDDDIPAGTIGWVQGAGHEPGTFEVAFPAGTWAFPQSELRLEKKADNGKRDVKRGEIVDFAKAAEMEPEALCVLLGARWEPVRGPRAVLGGRAGTVMQTREYDGVERIQVRWEDDGTESPDPWEDDAAIVVLDLDERLGEGSAVRHDGRRGTATTDPASNWDGQAWLHNSIEIRWEDDGTLSKSIKVSELEVEVTVGRKEFAAACAEQPERTARLHAGLLATTPGLKERAEAAVLEAKIAAVWRWADAVEDGDLGATELRRLAERVVPDDRHGSRPEVQYKELCRLLGLGPRAVLGGRAGTVIWIQESEDGVEKIQVRWEDDGTWSPWGYGEWDDAIKVSDLDKPLGLDPCEDPEVSIGREAFAAACHARERWGDPKVPVERWFKALQLELEEPGPGCLASAATSWPLCILYIAAAVVLLAHWLSDDGAGSGSYDHIDDDGWPMYMAGVAGVVVSIVACDIKRIHGRKAAAHKEAAERQVKEAVAQFEERKRYAEEEVVVNWSSEQVVVTCPEGVSAGEVLIVTAPDGRELEIVVPFGVRGGDRFELVVPDE